MTQYQSRGHVPPKRHTLAVDNEARLPEELFGQRGFSGASSLVYHRRSPSAIASAEVVDFKRQAPGPNAGLLPYHFRLGTMAVGGDPVTGRHVVAGNGDLTICYVAARTSSDLYRNASGDEIAYVVAGRASLDSGFGRLAVGAGDYVVVPASTTHRWSVDERAGELRLLVLEANGHVGFPARYLSREGQLQEGAPYSERDVRAPEGPLEEEGDDVAVLIRHRGGWARHVHCTHPFDFVGWAGCVYPYALAINAFEPIVGRIHQPPPVHQTFAGDGFVVCSFVPRPLDFDADAVRLPYHHANVDSDEVLFYVGGTFTSRQGTAIGMESMTLHPAGFVHGPQPGAYEASVGQTRTDETAVMIDTFHPLGITEEATGLADEGYLTSWARDAVALENQSSS